MREIKFRANRVDTKEFVHGYYVALSDNQPINNRIRHYILKEQYGDWGFRRFEEIEVVPETACQFTGERTFNKDEIYEHDILFDCNGDEWEVRFEDGKFICASASAKIDLHEISWEVEIIGTTVGRFLKENI